MEKLKSENVEASHTDHRVRLPTTRESITLRREACGFVYFLRVGFYEDSAEPGEVFCTVSKVGSDMGGIMDCLATTISIALQYHVPWRVLYGKYNETRFGHASTDECPSLMHSVAETINEAIVRRGSDLKAKQTPKEISVETGDT